MAKKRDSDEMSKGRKAPPFTKDKEEDGEKKKRADAVSDMGAGTPVASGSSHMPGQGDGIKTGA